MVPALSKDNSSYQPSATVVEKVHRGYGEQLRIETVARWAQGYVDYTALMRKVSEIRCANEAVAAFVNLAREEVQRSARFFASEVSGAAHRLREITGAAPQAALDAATRHGCTVATTPRERFAAPSAVAAFEVERGSEDARSMSAARGSLYRSRDPTQQLIVPLRELLSTIELLLRFVEVQKKTVRHAVDEAREAAPGGTLDEAPIGAALMESALTTELGTLRQLETAVKAELTVAGGATSNLLQPQGPAEAYDWIIKWRFVALAVLVLIVVACIPILAGNPEAHNCAAVILCVTVLWVTEAMPYFATALLIPLLAVPMNVLPGLDHKTSAKQLLGVMFNDTQVLVLGGLCMGKALGKHHLEEVVSRVLLRRVARFPALYLLTVMVLSALLCAVISNVAAPVLVVSVVQPSLWELPEGSGAAQAILLAVAFACNFGGMLTPIASPQNAVAQSALGSQSISFGVWLSVAAPIVLVGLIVSWALVLIVWRPFRDVPYIPMPLAKHYRASDAEAEGEKSGGITTAVIPPTAVAIARSDDLNPEQPSLRASQASLMALASVNQTRFKKIEIALIVAVIFATVVLWCVPQDAILGDTGAVALIPIVCFFGIGVLTKADFNSLSWHLIFLLSGGNMLGVMAQDSQLLQLVINGLKPFLEQHSTYQVMAVLIISVALVTTFVSHTVAALLLMPVVVRISAANPGLPSAEALVIMTVIMCSGSMGFPITSFPNVNSLLTEARDGTPYLIARNFAVPGFSITASVVLQLTTYMVPLAESALPRAAAVTPMPMFNMTIDG